MVEVNKGLLLKIQIFCISAVIIIAAYSNTLNAPFLFDDLNNIQLNVFIRLDKLTLQGLWDAGFNSIATNRPVANISYALNYYFGRYDVAGYHVVNIGIHLLCAVLLFFLLKTTFELCRGREKVLALPENTEPWLAAAAAALVWAVHPAQTQAVTYIVQRMVCMASMFYLLSLVLYVKGRTAGGAAKCAFFFGSTVSGILSLGTKEIAATLPVFMFIYEWYFFQDMDRQWLKKQAIRVSMVFVLLAVLTLVYFKGANPLSVINSQYAGRDFTLSQRLMTEFRIVLHYISLLALPHPGRLILDYNYPLSYSLIRPVTTILSMGAVIGLVIFAMVIAGKNRLISFAILWFFGNLVLESSVIPLELVYEHRMYLPSMFVIPLAVLGIIRYVKPRWAHLAVIGLMVAVLSVWTYQRNAVWGDEITFWKDNVEKSPGKARVHDNYGKALLNVNQYGEAAAQFEEAIRLSPKDAIAFNNLGVVYLRSANPLKAMGYFSKAVSLKPDYEDAYCNRGKALMQMNRFGEAVADFKKAVTHYPNFFEGFNNLGAAYMELGRYDEASTAFHRARELNPESLEVHYNLAIVYLKLNRDNEALREFMQVLVMKPGIEPVHLAVADILQRRGDVPGARNHLVEALRINPGNIEVKQKLDGLGRGN